MSLYREFTSQEEIDAGYNVEFSVPDFSVYADMYTNESAKARAELECLLDVPFGPTVDETLDIFPAADPNAPILVFIHGGYWRLLSSKEFSFVARGPVGRGYTTVVTNYSLCPKVSIDEITRQTRAALAWLARADRGFNGDRKRIFVSGHSAGAQQTAMALGTDWAGDYGLADDLVKGGLLISGVYDLRPLRYSWLQPKLLLSHETIQRQSPIFDLPSAAPAAVISVGADETPEFVRQSSDYFAAWQAAGLPGRYLPQKGKNHFDAIDGFLDADSELCESLATLIAAA